MRIKIGFLFCALVIGLNLYISLSGYYLQKVEITQFYYDQSKEISIHEGGRIMEAQMRENLIVDEFFETNNLSGDPKVIKKTKYVISYKKIK